MNQPYFILEFAHSIHGQFKRIHLSYRFLKYFASSVLLLLFLVTGLAGACLFMSWKVARYQTMQSDLEHLRTRYQNLQQLAKQRGVQIASLESLANEVSAAYGLRPQTAASPEEFTLDRESGSPDPQVRESIQAFNLLKAANYSDLYHRYAHQWQQNTQPTGWPVIGLLRSSFGERSDPFSGEGAFHTGIDLSAASGTQVHVTADGVVTSAGWGGDYGNLVVVNHGNGVQTYYAHLSETLVVPGQDVRLGQVIALSGGTGRATSPHLHYEVRIAGTPVNPYRFLGKEQVARNGRPAHDDLGL
jgi:murein DD-endopeptidase MepM/ murein hydrolase activator NlpD